jgi:ketosteroid isomerase-like protein
MKKTIQFGLYLMLASLILTLPVMAQNYDKELAALTKDYEKAYNKKDVKTLVSMYTADAVRDFSDGRHYSGAAEIEAAMVEEFAASNLKVSIMRGKSEMGPNGSIIGTGTYHLTGQLGGEEVDMMGSYTNTVKMVDGKMKISKSSLVVNP